MRPILNIKVGRETIVKELVFLGTGTSSCTPLLGCLMIKNPTCKVCLSAAVPGASKNRRLNTSALIRYQPSGAKGMALKNVLIDCGKSFYSAAIQFMVRDKMGPLEGVLLTHGHADAMFGLDDLRHFTGHGSIQTQVDIWADQLTTKVIKEAFPYLVDQDGATGGGFVSNLKFHNIDHENAFIVGELKITPLPVEHGTFSDGTPFPCLGFIMDDLIAYVSDVSRFPERSLQMIQNKAVLILDCLREHRPYKSHFILNQAMEIIEQVRPRTTFLIGMAHDVEHDEFEGRVKELMPSLDVRVSFDGLVLNFVQ